MLSVPNGFGLVRVGGTTPLHNVSELCARKANPAASYLARTSTVDDQNLRSSGRNELVDERKKGPVDRVCWGSGP